MNKQPIGILDSGVGGLSIFQEFILQLPHESIVYVGDHAHIPYGSKSEDEIYVLAKQLVSFLLQQNVKVIIIACNTITVTCLDRLRNEFPETSIIGTVPVIKTAAAVTRNRHIGILSTVRTSQSEYQQNLISEFANNCVVTNVGTNDLVPLIEAGNIDGEVLESTLRNILIPLQEDQVDTLALGCTHFPFIKAEITKILGPDVLLLDSAPAVSRQVKRVLKSNQVLAEQGKPKCVFYTTGDARKFDAVAKKLTRATIASEKISL